MQGIHPADRIPLLAAVIVMIAANVVGYFVGITVYISVLGAPFAVATFGLLRYFEDGTPYPAALTK